MEDSRDSMNSQRAAYRVASSGRGVQGQSWMGRALMAIGIGGAALVALCCVAPFLVAGVLAAVGLGFLLNNAILIGLLIVFAAAAVLGYYVIKRAKHV